MEENEVQALENEQEVISQEETLSDVATDDSVTLSKSEYSKLKRQAIAYQSTKGAEVKPRAEAPTPTGSDDKLKELELKIDGYNKDEIELIKEFGYEKVSNPIVQKAIEVMRQERKSKDADVQVANKSAVYKKYTNEDLQNMSVEELRKILPHADN
jgi:predicted metalloendopeptidase